MIRLLSPFLIRWRCETPALSLVNIPPFTRKLPFLIGWKCRTPVLSLVNIPPFTGILRIILSISNLRTSVSLPARDIIRFK